MKLSKDQAAGGFTASDASAVDLAASTATRFISVVTPLEYPATMVAWANRVHADGKHVWFRLASVNGGSLAHGDLGDGTPTFASGYLTNLHNLMLAHPELFRAGDILDGDAEAENSNWWVNHYGCGVQSSNCAATAAFNTFLQKMTTQENQDLATIGLAGCASLTATGCVWTQVHSTDPGTGTHELTNATVAQMGNLITIDAYPDQSTTDPQTAATAWKNAIASWKAAWAARGIAVQVLVGEWGYSNTINVTDAQQDAVIRAETAQSFSSVLGTNYWVGPGWVGAGGYTQVFYKDSGGVWHLRPAGSTLSAFYAAR